MKNSQIYIGVAITIVVISLVAYGIRSYMVSKITSIVPTETHENIESYIKNSINDITPVKATLGGTFYTTSIETHDGTGSVSYEDGHNSYIADFGYNIDEDGKVSIINFKIRE